MCAGQYDFLRLQYSASIVLAFVFALGLLFAGITIVAGNESFRTNYTWVLIVLVSTHYSLSSHVFMTFCF